MSAEAHHSSVRKNQRGFMRLEEALVVLISGFRYATLRVRTAELTAPDPY